MPPTRVGVRRPTRGHLSVPTSVAGLILAAAVATLHASSPRFFHATSQADFLKGDVQNLSVDNRGQLVLGPAAELIYDTAAPFLWSVIPGSDGSLFVGTGNQGRVIRIDAQGRGASFVDTAELEVHALATAPDGGLFVGTSPDGKIYKIDRNGTATTFFEPGEKYIWALAVDARGNLYAATGEKGVISTQPPARRASSTRSRLTARARGSIRSRPRMRSRSLLTERETFSSAPNPRAGCSGSMPTAKRSSSWTRPSRRSARSVSTTRACCTSRP